MNVLVTGAAGFIGSNLCDRLLAAGYDVVGMDNLTTGRRENLHRDVTFYHHDVSRTSHWWHLGGFKADLIVHCAASYDDRDKWHRDTDTNVTGGINAGIAARATGARILYLQTALVYGQNPYAGDNAPDVPYPLKTTAPLAPESSYAISKLAAEQYLRLSGVPLLTFRLANIYGPRNLSGPVPAFYKRVSQGDPATVVNTRRDFVYIDDLLDLVMQAVGTDATGTYHVSSGRDFPIGQVYDAVVDALDAYGGPEPTFMEPAADDAPTILLDPTETQRDFGWQATTDLDEGVGFAVDWYREHGVDALYTHLKVKG